MLKMIKNTVVAGSALALAGAANAAVDVTSITASATDIGLVGQAVFAIYVAIKAFHWIRRAL